jgi:hypothetical protein
MTAQPPAPLPDTLDAAQAEIKRLRRALRDAEALTRDRRWDQREFYMVARQPIGPNARPQPTAKYTHLDLARDSAMRLAAGQRTNFVVLGVIEVVTPTDTLTKRLL